MMADDSRDNGLEAVIEHVHRLRGFDFRGYKRSSLRRRIEKRMADMHISDYDTYIGYLEAHPDEYTELLNTILINVTSFFRDVAFWEKLGRTALDEIVRAKGGHDPIRAWSAGCATGEEAYTLAILLAERLDPDRFRERVKIYATDPDEDALAFARRGTYDAKAVEPIPPRLLEKYFEKANGQYVCRRDMRNAIIFGRHSIVSDAPISNVDLLVCRNVLIYLDSETQGIVLPRLHYALSASGFLFLGRAETMLARSRLFRPVDLTARIFAKIPQPGRLEELLGAALPFQRPRSFSNNDNSMVIEAALQQSSGARFVVNADGILVSANRSAGETFGVRDSDVGLLFRDLDVSYQPVELRGHMEQAKRNGHAVRLEDVRWGGLGGETIRLDVEIVPLKGPDEQSLGTAINFSDATATHELREQLRAINEELETTNEELQSANEELETTNEELQSTNEELETMNEELQSTNEELETTNEELQSTNDELRVRGDEFTDYRTYLEAVLRSIAAGIVILDDNLRVVTWNKWNENTWGLRAEEVQGTSFFDLDIGLPVHLFRDCFKQVLRGDRGGANLELEALDRRGSPLAIRASISRLETDSGNQGGLTILLLQLADGPNENPRPPGREPRPDGSKSGENI